jgi:hypothetical protein
LKHRKGSVGFVMAAGHEVRRHPTEICSDNAYGRAQDPLDVGIMAPH